MTMLKIKLQQTILTNLQEKYESCLCPTRRGPTMSSANNSQHHRLLNWSVYTILIETTQAEQTFHSMLAETIVPRLAADENTIFSGKFKHVSSRS